MCFKQNKLLSKSKEIICLFVMAMFMLVFILFQYSTISNRNFENLDAVALANKFLIIAIIATVVVISSYFLLIKKEIAIHNIYFCAVTIMALSYMTIFCHILCQMKYYIIFLHIGYPIIFCLISNKALRMFC